MTAMYRMQVLSQTWMCIITMFFQVTVFTYVNSFVLKVSFTRNFIILLQFFHVVFVLDYLNIMSTINYYIEYLNFQLIITLHASTARKSETYHLQFIINDVKGNCRSQETEQTSLKMSTQCEMLLETMFWVHWFKMLKQDKRANYYFFSYETNFHVI